MMFIGWLVFGLLLGPSLWSVNPPSWFAPVSQIAGGAFLFLAGWEMRFLDLKKDCRFYFLMIIGSFLIPVFAGLLFFQGNLFVGFALGISALPVAIQILKEKGLYNTTLARRAITLSSLCDIVAWLALALMLPKANAISWIFSHWIVFAFFVGLLVGRLRPYPEGRRLHHFQGWLLAPLFFIGLGWKIDLVTMFSPSSFMKLFVVAVLAKSLGSYVFSRVSGQTHHDSWNLAVILNARGAMEVLAAHYAYSAGIIDGPVFAGLVMLGILTSVMAVPLVKK